MAKFKLTLGRLPDFKMPVSFVLPNGDEAKIIFTVRHKSAEEIQELFARDDIRDGDFILELATAWDLEEEFNKENVDALIKLYPSAALGLSQTYMRALAGQRVKN